MVESIHKSDLDDYTDEKKLEVYQSFMEAPSHNKRKIQQDSYVIIKTLNTIIEPEIIEGWDEESWQEFLESWGVETE